jgi:transposase
MGRQRGSHQWIDCQPWPAVRSGSKSFRVQDRSVHCSQSFLGHFYRRMRAKLGAPKAITAAAHKLARILYHMVTTGHAYDETICAQNEMQNRKRMEARLRKQAREFGLQLVAL